MMYFNKLGIFIVIIGIGIIYFVSNLIVEDRVSSLVGQKYSNVAKTIKATAKVAVEDKINSTLALAVAISQDNTLKQALQTNNPKLIDLNHIAKELQKYTSFKRPWLHLISKDGRSVLKSWATEKGENLLNIRLDLKKILQEPKVTTIISVGKFNMTFKAIVPVYQGEKFLGLFEFITNFDSVAKNLQKHTANVVILTDKRYKRQLKIPYTKIFIQDYYVANSNANKNLLALIKEKGVGYFIDSDKSYHIHEKSQNLITFYELPDVNGKSMGYFILFKPLSSIDMTDISNEKKSLFFILVSIFILLISVVYYFTHRLHTKNIEHLNSELESTNSNMDTLNRTLEHKVQKEVEDNQLKDTLVFQQSKMASMGEMIGNIAHQWRQPIAIISMWANNIIVDLDMGEIKDENLRKYAENINKQTQHLSQTIDDFRNFFSPNKEKTIFTIKDSLEKTLSLMVASFKNHNIEIVENIEDIKIEALENELTQALLNIIKNAKDILVTLPSEKKKIVFIDIYRDDNKAIIKIKDNGGGIDSITIDKVFEPYFTTKHKSQGTGIGLYMTESIIVKHLYGAIRVHNSRYKYDGKDYVGAEFVIEIPL